MKRLTCPRCGLPCRNVRRLAGYLVGPAINVCLRCFVQCTKIMKAETQAPGKEQGSK